MNSPQGTGRVILSVIGPHSDCGKTTFVAHLLRHVPGLGCLKISPAHEWPGKSPASGVVIGGDYYLEGWADLNRPGKDTALYLAAGAARARRLRHRRDGLAAGLEAALHDYPPGMSVVVEGSRAVRLLQPVAVVLVVRPPIREMKPATEAILSRVTDLLINASDGEGQAAAEARRLPQEFPALHPQYTWTADLILQPPPDDMLARLRSLLTPGPR